MRQVIYNASQILYVNIFDDFVMRLLSYSHHLINILNHDLSPNTPVDKDIKFNIILSVSVGSCGMTGIVLTRNS